MHVCLAFWRGVFACLELCFQQVTGNTHISSRHMVNKAMTGPLMSLHSIIMKEVIVIYLYPAARHLSLSQVFQLLTFAAVHVCLQVTLSTVSSRPSISRALVSSSHSASSSTPLNKVTPGSRRDMVRRIHNL